MVFRRRVGILSANQLEGLYVLQGHVVTQRQPAVAQRLVDHGAGPFVANLLCRICIQCPLVDVGAIRQFRRVGADDPLHDRPLGGIGRCRNALVGGWYQHVAVHLPQQPPLAHLHPQRGAVPQRGPEAEPVVVRACRSDVTYLKKGPGREGAVLMAPGELAVHVASGRFGQVQARRRCPTVFQSEVRLLGLEAPDDCGSCSHAPQQFLQYVVVDQGEPNVLVPLSLAGLGIHFSQQVEPGALAFIPCAYRDNRFGPSGGPGVIGVRGRGFPGSGSALLVCSCRGSRRSE